MEKREVQEKKVFLAQFISVRMEATKEIEGLSYRTLGEMSEISHVAIQRFLTGRYNNISFKNLYRISSSMNFDFIEFLNPTWKPTADDWRLLEERAAKNALGRMHKNHTERLFNFILLNRPEILQSIVSDLSPKLLMESRYFSKRAIDLCGSTVDERMPVFIETQLTTMDKGHLKQILSIIRNPTVPDCKIVWITNKVTQKFDYEIKKALKESGRNIEVLIAEIESDFIKKNLKPLESLHSRQIYKEISDVKFSVPNFQKKHVITSPKVKATTSHFISPSSTSLNEATNRAFLEKLRKLVPYFITLRNEKSNLINHRMQFGSGTGIVEVCMTLNPSSRKKPSIYVRPAFILNVFERRALSRLFAELTIVPYSTQPTINGDSLYFEYQKSPDSTGKILIDTVRIFSVFADYNYKKAAITQK